MKAPAVIIITRHGARLDSEDKSWQDLSSSPWDTPLSYGGWSQTRALGARIASLLHARDIAVNEEEGVTKRRSSDAGFLNAERPSSSHSTHSTQSIHSTNSTKRRRHKVVVHTSPFLRCVQSSIAISAGMAQYQGNLAKFEAAGHTSHSKVSRTHGTHPRSQTLDSKAFAERFGSNIGPSSFDGPRPPSFIEPPRNRLRIDAFLGEWLSPGYFEFMTPPPPSNMLVAGAKADLLKAAEPINGARLAPDDNPSSYFPSGWGQHRDGAEEDTSSTMSMEEIARALPGHGSTSAFASLGITPGEPSERPKTPRTPGGRTVKGYAPPMPLYALAPKESIPAGFVAHARDACVDIDFSWDSMHEPQNWGDGGQYGEEWSAMHNRFRQGLRDMVQWYKTKGPDYDPQVDSEADEQSGEDDDQDLVLVIVTHSAGCNALIGALTNQPVLMDIGVASLTMATHKGRDAELSPSSPSEQRRGSLATGPRRRRSSIDTGLPHEYDMKLLASSDHLRAGTDPMSISQLSSPGMMPSIPERRVSMGLPSGAASPFELDRPRARNSALGSIRRKNTANSVSSRSMTGGVLTPMSAPGLWGGSGQSAADLDEHDEDIDPVTPSTSAIASPPPEPVSRLQAAPNGSLALGQSRGPSRANSGLWGDSRPNSSSGGLWNTSSRAPTASRQRSGSEKI